MLEQTTKEIKTTMKKVEFEIPYPQGKVVLPNLVDDDDSYVGGSSNVSEAQKSNNHMLL